MNLKRRALLSDADPALDAIEVALYAKYHENNKENRRKIAAECQVDVASIWVALQVCCAPMDSNPRLATHGHSPLRGLGTQMHYFNAPRARAFASTTSDAPPSCLCGSRSSALYRGRVRKGAPRDTLLLRKTLVRWMCYGPMGSVRTGNMPTAAANAHHARAQWENAAERSIRTAGANPRLVLRTLLLANRRCRPVHMRLVYACSTRTDVAGAALPPADAAAVGTLAYRRSSHAHLSQPAQLQSTCRRPPRPAP
ncbi:hypothetical protein B0H17DRAFT_1127026 [Mycena rosella]|uniref:Uncharacterized protein n=1 Tax=Mycena rosella TaxID=1033263 RepID=A0AAD7M6T4_MYCRO|nr:hypothetical protein B0H17DRAFT_1127026 [Mycena rosella]